MNKNRKATEAAPIRRWDKDTHSFRILQESIIIFLSGRKVTALELNELVHSNDARKIISILRNQGMPIEDYRLPNHRKVYFLHAHE